MHPESRKEIRTRFKFVVLDSASYSGVMEACREFDVPRSTFYRWKKRYDEEGLTGLYLKKTTPKRDPRMTPPEVVEKILKIRKECQLGPLRIKYYLDRYYGINVSGSTVYRVLRANGVNQLPKTAPRRAIHTKRYAKYVPGHHVQVDVKFLKLKDAAGKPVKRYQYTAIDDATRIRTMQIYAKHN
ncbi:MAG TPA: helix-turn-helix domain-containing protein [Anaerolineales bacterium]|nr:helix-turn-helix domain-containing protein [Anaerolineales bacterium]